MIAATGDSTRFLEYFLQFRKTYFATIELGVETDTLDNTGEGIKSMPVPEIHEAALEAACARFTGVIEQIPPVFSNVRVDGRRAHELARDGKPAEPSARKTETHEISLVLRSKNSIDMQCTVSSGTYIRSLARDIAQALGTCGHLTFLRRTQIGEFSVATEVPEYLGQVGFITQQLTDTEALSFFEHVEIAEWERRRLYQGQAIRLAANVAPGIKRVHAAGRFAGLAKCDGRVLRVEKIFPSAADNGPDLTRRGI